jgi:hypothetical protein
MNFGGDTSCPILYKYPYILLPVSSNIDENKLDFLKKDASILFDEIGCDSGSFMFLPIMETIPKKILKTINNAVSKKNAANIKIPTGNWSLYYEQSEAPQPNMNNLYRNIVLKHDS